MKKYRLLIADDEVLICRMMEKIIHFDEFGLELVGTALDGEELWSMIAESRPDIVITDITMPKVSGIEVIRRVTEAGIKCRFIIISGYKQFEYVHEALRYSVENYILKPIDETELNHTLSKVVKELQTGAFVENLNGMCSSVQRRLLTHGIDEPEFCDLSLNQVNQNYLTNFNDGGVFRFVSIRLDFINLEERILPDTSSPLIDAFFELLENTLVSSLYCDYHANVYEAGMCLLNYPEGQDKIILDKIKECYEITEQNVLKFSNLEVTICVSGLYKDYRMLSAAKQEVFFSEYARIGLGRNRMIYYDDILQIREQRFQDKMDELEARIKKALDVYDMSQIKACLDEFFAFPRGVKISEPAWRFLGQVRNNYVELYRPRLMKMRKGNLLQETCRLLDFCRTLEEYRVVLEERFRSTMEILSAEMMSQSVRPVKQAMEYVAANYQTKIVMEEVAESVGLSTVYFSYLFKRETGENFTEYVTRQRIEAAKNLLADTNLNVSEVAWQVGFADVRYFSKLFKKMVGVKPTDYRKIYD